MSTKSSKVKKSRTTRAALKRAKPLLAIEDDERHRGDVADYISRNRDALNASIRKSRREVAEGKTSSKSIDAIIADGRQRRLRQS